MKILLEYISSGQGLLYSGIFLIVIFGVVFILLYKSKYKSYIGQALIPITFIEIAILIKAILARH